MNHFLKWTLKYHFFFARKWQNIITKRIAKCPFSPLLSLIREYFSLWSRMIRGYHSVTKQARQLIWNRCFRGSKNEFYEIYFFFFSETITPNTNSPKDCDISGISLFLRNPFLRYYIDRCYIHSYVGTYIKICNHLKCYKAFYEELILK